jgi:hypothetical protein
MYSINSHIDSLREKHQQVIQDSEKHTEDYIRLLTQASCQFPKIEQAFDKCGFTILDYTCRKSGIREDGDQLYVNFKIIPKSPKYRYINFNGYTKSGAGKNQPKLRERADKLEMEILTYTGLECEVNPYCFEIGRGKDKGGSILVDFWFK